jgi:hypothetical protein
MVESCNEKNPSTLFSLWLLTLTARALKKYFKVYGEPCVEDHPIDQLISYCKLCWPAR